MGEHDGHRTRMKQRFLKYGLENFDDHNVLELLLFYAIPRQDTNVLAHRLMNAFGTLSGVFSATPEELMQVEGIKENAATLIRLVSESARRYLMFMPGKEVILNSVKKVGAYFVPRFLNCRNEVMYMACLDPNDRVIDCSIIQEGNMDHIQIDMRKILTNVLTKNADKVIIAHNHLNGLPLPSLADKETTRYLYEMLQKVDVELMDHIIVAKGEYLSMAATGSLPGHKFQG